MDKGIRHIGRLRVLKGQQVRANAIEVRTQFVEVHHIWISFEHLPITLPVGSREFH